MTLQERLERLMPKGKIVTIPMDDGLLDGPVGGLKDMRAKVKEIVAAQPDAILGFLGPWKQCREDIGETAYVLNLTASTKYSSNPQQKVQIYSVEQAVALGVAGVAVHLNVGSLHIHEQLEILARVAAEAYIAELPVMAIAYPRGEQMREDGLVDATCYAVRLAAEAGADIVKTKYVGGKEAFAHVVASTPIPVIMAGGAKVDTRTILQNVYDCIDVGGKGVAIGRNAFHHQNTTAFVQAVKRIVHGGLTVERVMEEYRLG